MRVDEARRVVELATMAPSIHNTQPWRFEVRDDQIDLYADRRQALHVVDPAGRQLLLSCGVALEHARLGVRSLGRACTVERFPSAENPDLLARLTVGPASPPTDVERGLVIAIPLRRTHREAFDPRPVPVELVVDMRGLAESRGAWLYPVRERTDLTVLAVALSRADSAEAADPAYREELRRWRTTGQGTGIPDSSVPDLGGRASSLPLRDFDLGSHTSAEQTLDQPPPPVERPLVLLIGTDSDDPGAWLRAGEALAAVTLRATAAGAAASPLNQALDLRATRSQLRHELRLLGFPQMLLRMGYPVADLPATPRRPVEDVLTFPAADPTAAASGVKPGTVA